jgi:hypothetical protein
MTALILLFAAAASAPAANPFLGRWDLTVRSTNGTDPGWLEVTQANNALAVRMVGRVGGAKRPDRFELAGDSLVLHSRDWFGKYESVEYSIRRDGPNLVGNVKRESGELLQLSGEPAPSLARTRPPKWGPAVSLSSLSGWEPMRAPSRWSEEAGVLKNSAAGPNLRTKAVYDDFQLHLEFLCGDNCNSGVYLRGRYEVAIDNYPNTEGAEHKTGAIYGFVPVTAAQPVKPGEWQSLDITLTGRRVSVRHNGVLVLDDQEIPGPTGGALDTREAAPGPLLLQGDHGPVSYRNLSIRPAK